MMIIGVDNYSFEIDDYWITREGYPYSFRLREVKNSELIISNDFDQANTNSLKKELSTYLFYYKKAVEKYKKFMLLK